MTLLINDDTELGSDQLPATGVAVQFDAPSVTLTITLTVLADVAVVSQDSIAIYSNESGSVLNNHGDLLTGAFAYSAVYFSGNFGQLTNEAAGTITGISNAVAMGSNGGDFTNHGTVRAITGDGVSLFASTATTLFNDGDIYGRQSGIYTESGSSLIENEGNITSHAWGIFVGSGAATIKQGNNRGVDGRWRRFTDKRYAQISPTAARLTARSIARPASATTPSSIAA